ncbi:MAG: hypothetical protein ABIP36_08690 [Acidimicrobiales bacterium]
MTTVSRRSFLAKGGAGVAGVATVAAGGIALTGGSAGAAERSLDAEELAVLDRPMLLQIRDAAAGEVEILVGDTEIVFTDRALVARVLRASR